MKKLSLQDLNLDENLKLSKKEKKEITGGCDIVCYDCINGTFCYNQCIDHPYPCD